jgi:mRNA interferase RelE/StbE
MSGVSWEFEIIFSPRAKRHLKALDRSIQTRIKEAVAHNLVCFPPRGDVIKLEGGEGTELRLRVGDWRVTFEYDFKLRQVHILSIKHRREAYRRRK